MEDLIVWEAISTIVLNTLLIVATFFGWREFSQWKRKLRTERATLVIELMNSDVSRVCDSLYFLGEMYDSFIRFAEEDGLSLIDDRTFNKLRKKKGIGNAYKIIKLKEKDFEKLTQDPEFQNRKHKVTAVLGQEAKELYWSMETTSMIFDFFWESETVESYKTNLQRLRDQTNDLKEASEEIYSRYK